MNAKPIDMLLADKRSHVSKEQVSARRKAETEIMGGIGPGRMRVPDFLRDDQVAMAKWRDCMRLYRNCTFLTASDAGNLARYCCAYSEYLDLLKKRRAISNIEFTEEEEKESSRVIEEERGKVAVNRLWRKIEYVLSVDGVLSIDSAINKKMEALLKMEDRLFLNPLAKIKNVPRVASQKQKEKTPLEEAGFGGV
jgi:phage terminase small subunit